MTIGVFFFVKNVYGIYLAAGLDLTSPSDNEQKEQAMRVLTSQECRALDQNIQDKLNLSDELLMESVGGQCALLIFQEAQQRNISEINILCGPGNNGGDGLVIARHLKAMNLQTRVFIDRESPSDLVAAQIRRLESLGVSLESYSKLENLAKKRKQRIFVDALFGVGLSKNLDSSYLNRIDGINGLSGFKISIDAPSGLNLDTGEDWGGVVKAHLTLAIAAPKPGFFTAQGPMQVGRIKIVSSSFNQAHFPDSKSKYFVITPKQILSHLPKRDLRSHKGSVGKVHLFVGSNDYLGAARLCAMSALASGASFVILHGSSEMIPLLKDFPEVILKMDRKSFLENLSDKDSVVIGSGGTDIAALSQVLIQVKDLGHKKVLLDAGAFRAMNQLKLKALDEWIWTPHPGEMAGLLGLKTAEVEANRFAALSEAQQKWGGQFLLKGYQPVFKTHPNDTWCLPYGDKRLGKAGTGDVLSGLIGGLLAQNIPTEWAVALGVYVHAKSAQRITIGRNSQSLLTSELAAVIGQMMKPS